MSIEVHIEVETDFWGDQTGPITTRIIKIKRPK